MPLNRPSKAETTPPPTPTLGTRIAAFVILASIVASPFLWMAGSGPLLHALSPLVCPEGSELFLRSEYDTRITSPDPNHRNDVNFDCAGHGQLVENNADVILFSICGGPFIVVMLWGFVGSFFRKKKVPLELPRRKKS